MCKESIDDFPVLFGSRGDQAAIRSNSRRPAGLEPRRICANRVWRHSEISTPQLSCAPASAARRLWSVVWANVQQPPVGARLPGPEFGMRSYCFKGDAEAFLAIFSSVNPELCLCCSGMPIVTAVLPRGDQYRTSCFQHPETPRIDVRRSGHAPTSALSRLACRERQTAWFN